MRLAVTLLAVALLCGCMFWGSDKNVEVVDIGGVSSTTLAGTQQSTTSTAERTTSTTVPVTSTTSTVTSTPSTTTTILVFMTPEETTTTTIAPIIIPIVTLMPTTTTSTSTTTTIACSVECYDIRLPSPRTCAEGCCISSDTRCVYVSSTRDGSRCQCR